MQLKWLINYNLHKLKNDDKLKYKIIHFQINGIKMNILQRKNAKNKILLAFLF